MIKVFIIMDYRKEPHMETVSNYMFDDKGNLKLYDRGRMWFFPYTHIQYVAIREEEAD